MKQLHHTILGIILLLASAALPSNLFSSDVPLPSSAYAQSPGQARVFLVFFPLHSTNLSAKAHSIIADAAATLGRSQSLMRVEVNGHNDTSEDSGSSADIAMRRAQAVAADFLQQVAPKTAISIRAIGSRQPLVPAAPGEPKAENRRVEIILR